MDIQITSRHEKASKTLQESIKSDLQKLEKFHDKITSCRVILDQEHTHKVVEIVMSILNHTVSATAKADNIGKAFDSTMQKIERQLKKFNEKNKDHKAEKS
jgi:putative sigma-54 modulation protein